MIHDDRHVHDEQETTSTTTISSTSAQSRTDSTTHSFTDSTTDSFIGSSTESFIDSTTDSFVDSTTDFFVDSMTDIFVDSPTDSFIDSTTDFFIDSTTDSRSTRGRASEADEATEAERSGDIDDVTESGNTGVINYVGDYETVEEHLRRLDLSAGSRPHGIPDGIPDICQGNFDALSVLRNELFVFKDKVRLKKKKIVFFFGFSSFQGQHFGFKVNILVSRSKCRLLKVKMLVSM